MPQGKIYAANNSDLRTFLLKKFSVSVVELRTDEMFQDDSKDKALVNRIKKTSPAMHNHRVFVLVFLVLISQLSAAATVRVSTSLGDFSIELYEDVAPITVANFLSYVEAGRYNRTVFHRSESDFILQGGWLRFNPLNNSLLPITNSIDQHIENEFQLSNSLGTVAMAKEADDPNSASSQWFINLDDNGASLDEQNGGFTVFGKIIGDGMSVVEKIVAQPTYTIAGLTNFPLIDYYDDVIIFSNFINVSMSVEEEYSPPNYLDEASGRMQILLDSGSSGLFSVAFDLISADPTFIIQLDLSSVTPLNDKVANMASFNAAVGKLFLPELFIADRLAFRNMTFSLSDSELLIFRLDRFQKN